MAAGDEPNSTAIAVSSAPASSHCHHRQHHSFCSHCESEILFSLPPPVADLTTPHSLTGAGTTPLRFDPAHYLGPQLRPPINSSTQFRPIFSLFLIIFHITAWLLCCHRGTQPRLPTWPKCLVLVRYKWIYKWISSQKPIFL